jgi:hypothetical protein
VTRRTKTLLLAGAGVLLLAAVIFGVSALSSPTDSQGPPAITPLEQGDSLYERGMELLRSGDTTGAVRLFEQALVLNPTDEDAREQLRRIRGVPEAGSDDPGDGDVDKPPTGGQESDTFDPDAGFDRAVEFLGDLLPSGLEGYEMGSPLVEAQTASVPADPTRDGPVASVSRALFTVYDRGSVSDAKAFVTAVSKAAYDQDAADVEVNGVVAYYGTDGTKFAAVTYSRGRYVFEVILTSATGDPASLLDLAVAAASAFPTSL